MLTTVQPRLSSLQDCGPCTPSLRSRVAPFLALDVLAASHAIEQAGGHIIHMELGEPAAPAPRTAREAAMAALAHGQLGYTQSLGKPSLRARIAAHYKATYGIDVPASRIAVTTGSSSGFVLAFLALFDPGARIAISSPGYPAYQNIFDALGLETVLLETHAETRHAVTASMIAEAHAKKPLQGVLLMSPANPTGTMMTPDVLKDVAETCDRLGITFISDEIYHGLTYEAPAATALSYSPNVIVVNSFSKYFCMTGWRVGWLVLPEALVRPVERLHQSLAISAPTLGQIAAEAAFDGMEEMELVRAGYARNRGILLEELPKLGLGEFLPVDGAFYIYIDISHFTSDSLAFCKRLLEQGGVATTPGLDFDRRRGHQAMRLSFAGSEANVVEAVSRMKTFMAAGA